MSYLLKKISIVLVLLLAALPLLAQKHSIEVSAPAVVAAGDVFRIEFKINAKTDQFIPPTIVGFDLLAGPSSSESEQVVISNGNFVRTLTYAYTYVLSGNSEGKYTISRAGFVCDGTTLYSKPFTIEVVGDVATSKAASSSSSSSSAGTTSVAQTNKSGKVEQDDIRLVVSTDKTTVFKGQPVKVQLKIYTRIPIVNIANYKFPTFNGFWIQDITANNYPRQKEKLGDKVYDSHTMREYLIYPQQSGKLSIEQFDVTAIAQVVTQTKRQSVFDDFFGGGAMVQEISKKLVSSPVTITVKELPTGAPASFNGAVGSFTMSVEPPSGIIGANSASTYYVKISGSGNLPLIESPVIELPDSFEQYTPKTTENLNSTQKGISGTRQFEYPFIARAEGVYKLSPVEFTYFNPEQARYVTIKSDGSSLSVGPDVSGGNSSGTIVMGLNKEDVKILGEDIRFIKIGPPRLSSVGSMFMGSILYFILIVVIVALFLLLLFYLRKRIKEMRNTVATKGRKANKVALQRLNAAQGYMKDGNRHLFYQEMLRALWGYMSDKLNIPVANITKENVREELVKRGVQPDQAERFISLISDCEFAQYSPDEATQMQEIYNCAVGSISKLDTIIKKNV